MRSDTRSYYEQRAEAELEMAQQAEHPAAVRAHYELAGMYLDQLHRKPARSEEDRPSA
jgi:hypothetical protein